ncbi:MAG: phosphomethylpyrimidine synthase ThiC, partial [Pseudomonadota bacterium]
MSANAKDFEARVGELSRAVTGPLPGSSKLYVQGSRPDLRVPMRRVVQAPKAPGEQGERPDIVLYDTSGPYSDPDQSIDLMAG